MKNIIILVILSPFLFYALKSVFLYIKDFATAKCSGCACASSCSNKKNCH